MSYGHLNKSFTHVGIIKTKAFNRQCNLISPEKLLNSKEETGCHMSSSCSIHCLFNLNPNSRGRHKETSVPGKTAWMLHKTCTTHKGFCLSLLRWTDFYCVNKVFIKALLVFNSVVYPISQKIVQCCSQWYNSIVNSFIILAIDPEAFAVSQ